MNHTIFVQKKPQFDDVSNDMSKMLRESLFMEASVVLIQGYQVTGLSQEVWQLAIPRVFVEEMVETSCVTLAPTTHTRFMKELLPGQFDQKAESANQCLKLLDATLNSRVSTFEVVLFDRVLSAKEQEKFLKYWINPIESMLKVNFEEVKTQPHSMEKKMLTEFNLKTEEQLKQMKQEQQLAMGLEDLRLIQQYFSHEHRDPTETELRVLDTYWSDHCRHTTFLTHLSSVELLDGPLQSTIQSTFELYRAQRKQLNRTNRPYTLMDLATITAKAIQDPNVEISDEVNACSFVSDVVIEGRSEKWLIQFKNETHNHPTEIEPFGGASTCIGGCIRDPLSGRAYVYQAMRISGCGDVTLPLEATLKDKLPASKIARGATLGNSSYGNQIGVATTYVQEIYDPSYVAKHLELGAVVGAVAQNRIQRTKPQPDDVVLVLGGKTGRDGIGGATGSSKAHTEHSLLECAAQVQKGNAPEERKLQRLFRHPEILKIIKKSNDFGAGGVSVAIGELADGLDIDLSALPLKYEGLTPTEIAISESQERMAVVVDPKDVLRFQQLAALEDVDVSVVAKVTDTNRLIMRYQGEIWVDLDRDFLDSAGATYSQAVVCSSTPNMKQPTETLSEQTAYQHLASLNISLSKGLIEQFDASIGATTVLFPLGGRTLSTPALASVQRVSVEGARSETATILASGFSTTLAKLHPYISGQGSVLLSMAKTLAVGGHIHKIYFSFQEYFARLGQDHRKWGNVVSTLLGAMSITSAFKRPAIGGKDSMSGSFNELDVLDTFVSFACSTVDATRVKSNEFKQNDSYIYLVLTPRSPHLDFDVNEVVERFYWMEQLIGQSNVLSVGVVEKTLFATLVSMAAGNRVGLNIECTLSMLDEYPASFILETSEPMLDERAILIGRTGNQSIQINEVSLDLNQVFAHYTSGLNFLYPTLSQKDTRELVVPVVSREDVLYPYPAKEQVNVLIPVFFGTNCEMDTALAFKEVGGTIASCVIATSSQPRLQASIDQFAQNIDDADILVFPGGFSMGDQPSGSAKFIVNVIKHPQVKAAIERLLQRKGLILGICNGFQALIKSGLLPYGKIMDVSSDDATLTHNTIGRHLSTIVSTKAVNCWSPWMQGISPHSVSKVPISHGEGRLVVSDTQLKEWFSQGLIAQQYCDDAGYVSNHDSINVNGSTYAIEALVSPCGQILGKMGHSERIVDGLYQNISMIEQRSILQNGIDYFQRKR